MRDKKYSLSMLFSVYDDGILTLINNIPDANENVEIIIVHQLITDKCYNGLFDILNKRNDIQYIKSFTKGVTKSRNIAIRRASNDIILFCDDDTRFDENLYTIINNAYNSEENCEFITFAYWRGKLGHKFKTRSYKHNIKTILNVGTIEVSCKREFILSNNIFFPEDMGAGEKYFLCDEPVFLSRILKKKGRGVYIPKFICTHDEESSGDNFNDRNAFVSRYLCFQRVFGISMGWGAYILFLIKNIKKIKTIKVFIIAISVLFKVQK